MTNFLKQESEIVVEHGALSYEDADLREKSRVMGYEAAHLLCYRLTAQGIRPHQLGIQMHISLDGWYDDLMNSASGVYNFGSFVTGTSQAWQEISEGIIL